MEIINTSAYKFIELDQLENRQIALKQKCESLQVKGTILLSSEGININLAGTADSIETIECYFHEQSEFSDLWFKRSPSSFVPFQKIKVRIKPEIITFKQDEIKPEKHTVKHLSPKTFKAWLDEGRELTVLDTRNDYEMEYGHFENAVNLNIEYFTDLPEAVSEQMADLKEKPLVMYCTGGVRCEKAGPLVENLGFKEVYQLDGGILAYFQECGGAHYVGDCFVFDDRLAVDPQLQELPLTDEQRVKLSQHTLRAASAIINESANESENESN